MFKYSPTLLRLQKASAKAIFHPPCFITSTLSLRLTVTSSAQFTLTPCSFSHPQLRLFKDFLCLCGNYTKTHISWKVHHYDPFEFSFHGGWWDCLQAVMKSVWQPAVSWVSQLFQSGSFAFMQYNNRLSLLSWESAPLSSLADGIVWSELHKKPGNELMILRNKKVLSWLRGFGSAAVMTCLLCLKLDAVVTFPSFKSPCNT